MVINVPAAYAFYLLPVFFPGVIWLGLAPILFGFVEVLLHGGRRVREGEGAWLADRNSPYPFAPEELSRFERYRCLVHAAVHPH
jgi:hypothetical protein